jgi:hypothetical protein
VDTLASAPAEGCTTTVDSIFNIVDTTITRTVGFTTFDQDVVRFELHTVTDCDPPYEAFRVSYDWDTSAPSFIAWDDFTQDQFALIDYSAFGWKYKPWIVSPVIEAAGASLGSITPPAWNYEALNAIPGADGGLLTTGTFAEITLPDDDNPHSLSDRVPAFPGEDFLTNLPNGVMTPINLVTNDQDSIGSVFITLQPDNYTVTTTIFPLFLFIRELPAFQGQIDPGNDSLVQITMQGYMQTNDPTRGFPKVRVEIERF